ncbi:MAG: tRNA (adenosine(37)-N6)-threonylcarbamoyltransferase complex ATPase subunit type 1 TsaE [Chitinophagaceae bacterium]|nr:tRNA (adenosine(37)-N6)-threonylcarbamoyltransferase complex ATPase subunit type 1 TsaE [Oligoflexus sp.]
MRTIVKDLICGEADPKLIAHLRDELESRSSYTLWLVGEMGAGKTSLVRAFLYSLGLPDATPVVSPTYTIMNEYRVAADWYAHLDLYRANGSFSLDELGVYGIRAFKGIFVEWPEQGGESETLPPTHKLFIDTISMDKRSYTLVACD